MIPYTYQRNGIFYFSRLVPKDLRSHYEKPRLVISLKSRCKKYAEMAAKQLNAKLADYWMELRIIDKSDRTPFNQLIRNDITTSSIDAPTLLNAYDLYIEKKGHNRNPSFFNAAKSATNYVIKWVGNYTLDRYTSKDAALVRDRLLNKGLKRSSTKKDLGVIKAIINFVILEQGLECKNAFASVYLEADQEPSSRISVKGSELQKIQSLCVQEDDDVRHLVALISDTGLRLAEAAGLLISDIVLDAETPHLIVKKHPHRSLKTQASARKVPLVGIALWAARRIIAHSTSLGPHLFEAMHSPSQPIQP